MSIIIFALPMPVQIAERPHDSNEHNASDISDVRSVGRHQNQRNRDDGLEGIEMQTRSGTTDANVDEHQQESDEAEGTQISPELYSKQIKLRWYSYSFSMLCQLRLVSDSEKGSDNVGSHQRMKRFLLCHLKTSLKLLKQVAQRAEISSQAARAGKSSSPFAFALPPASRDQLLVSIPTRVFGFDTTRTDRSTCEPPSPDLAGLLMR
eukprot:763720-Hanusia_phi.AAC.1